MSARSRCRASPLRASKVTGAEPVERARELARESRFLSLCRIGFFGRGLLYLLIGYLALRTGQTEDVAGIFDYLNDGAGRLLLLAIGLGLAAYGLWRLADGAFGIEHPGSTGRAKRLRIAAAVIGVIYLYLAFVAARVLLGGDSEGSPQHQARMVLDWPGGSLVLGLVALALIASGFVQLRNAWTCSFLEPLDRRALSPLVRWLGRIGYAARGIIFLIVGFLLARAAVEGLSSKAGGMEEALDLLSRPLLFTMAIGLFLFGLFSMVEALYRRIHEPPPPEEMKRELAEKLQ
jgi:hypothetical protein